MNREIKFRGKRVDNGEWVYGDIIHCTSGKTYIFPSGDYANESDKVNQEGCLMMFTFEVVPKTAGQLTGLYDKNGKKIYEGDIVKAWVNFGPAGDEQRINTVQITPFGTNLQSWIFEENMLPEIIGNIHDNPELLEVV